MVEITCTYIATKLTSVQTGVVVVYFHYNVLELLVRTTNGKCHTFWIEEVLRREQHFKLLETT